MFDFISKHKQLSTQMPRTLSIHQQYSERLQSYLLERFIKPLPLLDQIRARRELKLMKSIRRKLFINHLILRQTDKSGVLHIGHRKDYNRKAKQYRQDTQAYEQLTTNPYDDVFMKVVKFINQLRIDNKIKEKHKSEMMPKRNKTELGYMYFLPKSHKVIIISIKSS